MTDFLKTSKSKLIRSNKIASEPDTDITNTTDSDRDDNILSDSIDQTDQTDQIDPTDIYDSDEDEINKLEENDDFVNKELENEQYSFAIRRVYEIFLLKHEHLDNYKNRNIIFELCKMAVNNIPEHISNPNFYLNFIESSINLMSQTTVEDIAKSND